MSLHMFAVFAEAGSVNKAFAAAQQDPLLAGRTLYEIIDPTTIFPSDALAISRAEWIFGVQPQADKVYIAGEHTNTVWAIRVHTMNPGQQRLLFFGLTRD
jgi:hypothetical protein